MTNQEGSSSQLPTNDEPINFSIDVPTGSPEFIVEPEVKEAEDRIWKSQVIIPCPNSPHAYLGPILDDKDKNEELSAISLCFAKTFAFNFHQGLTQLHLL